MSGGREKFDSQQLGGRRVGDLIARHWRKLAGGLVTLIVAPVAVALISNALSGDKGNTDAGIKLGPHLRADKFGVRNPEGRDVPTQAVIGGVKQVAYKQTQASMPRVVLTISNTGERRAVLTGMVFTVRDYADLRPCEGRGGATRLDGEYQVRLPVPARRGQSIGLDLDRDIAPGGVDRFALRFAVPEALYPGGEQLYVLDVAAQVSPVATPQRLGAIAISAPGPPDALYLGLGDSTLPPSRSACDVREGHDLQRIANHRGVAVDARLKAVADQAARIDARQRQ
jgi:hypothetical protein